MVGCLGLNLGGVCYSICVGVSFVVGLLTIGYGGFLCAYSSFVYTLWFSRFPLMYLFLDYSVFSFRVVV